MRCYACTRLVPKAHLIFQLVWHGVASLHDGARRFHLRGEFRVVLGDAQAVGRLGDAEQFVREDRARRIADLRELECVHGSPRLLIQV